MGLISCSKIRIQYECLSNLDGTEENFDSLWGRSVEIEKTSAPLSLYQSSCSLNRTTEERLPLCSRLLSRGAMFYREGGPEAVLCRLIGYVERHTDSWDCFGALAVIQAAGGTINDFLADDGLWKGNGVIAGSDTGPPILSSEGCEPWNAKF